MTNERQAFTLTVAEPWELSSYLYGRAFSARPVLQRDDLWIAELEQPIVIGDQLTTYVRLAARYANAPLSGALDAGAIAVSIVGLDAAPQPESLFSVGNAAELPSSVFLAVGSLRREGPVRRANADGVTFYATAADYDVLAEIDHEARFRYIVSGRYDDRAGVSYDRVTDIPGLGTSENGEWRSGSSAYWIVDREGPLPTLLLRGPGGSKNEIQSPHGGVEFGASGVYRGTALIAGCFAYRHASGWIKRIYETYANRIKDQFVLVHGCWLGPDALRLYDLGMRLTTSVSSKMPFDLPAGMALRHPHQTDRDQQR